MRKTVLFSGLICLALTAAPPPQSVGPAHLAFEPNQGQWPSTSSFSTRAPNFTALFSPSGVGFLLGSADHHSKLSMRWLGASPVSTLAPMERLQGTANYYRGSDPAHWITNLPTYKRLKAANIYPGIDVIYYGLDGQFEFDLVLSPGTPVSRIQLAFEGARPRLNTDGDLCFETTSGSLIHHGPVAYQEIAGVRRSVAAHYVIGSSDTVSIAVSSYDKRHALVIDPTVAFATTIGGTTSENEGHAMALDAAGNIYLVGSTFSPSFPTVNALQSTLGASCCGETDAFVSKLSPDGATVLFSTYLGGSGFDTASGVAVDSTGNAVVVGTTSSPDFPVKAAYQAAIHGTQDAFIVKFSPTGSLLYGTYLGGQGTETAWALALDAADNIYLTGTTSSADFPRAGAYSAGYRGGGGDGYVTKMAADGSGLIFSNYLGGTDYEQPNGIAIGPDSSVYVAGYTSSQDFPLANAFQSTGGNPVAFVTRFAADGGSLIYSTYLGPTGTPRSSGAAAIDVDSTGAAYIAGGSAAGFPLKNPIQATVGSVSGSPFVVKLSPDGGSLIYSTYLGGNGLDQAKSIKADAAGNVTIVGSTDSTNFPTVAAFRTQAGQQDAFVTQIDAAGQNITFSSYLGGNYLDTANAVVLNRAGDIYVAGTTFSYNFPNNAQYYAGTAFVAKLSGAVGVSIPVTFTTVPAGLQVTVDGGAVTTPKTFYWVPGLKHTIDVPTPQLLPGPDVAHFLSWSNGGPQTQTFTTPAAATTFTATLDNVPCVYAFNPPEPVNFGQIGGDDLVNVVTQIGCPWTVTPSASWIVSAGPNYVFNGPASIDISVNRNPSTAIRNGTVSAGSATLSITQGPSVPTVGLQSAFVGSGSRQTLQFVIADLDGAANLGVSNVLINSALDGRSACYLAFDHVGQVLYLVDDAGKDITGMAFANGRGSGTLSNSQCSIDGSSSSITPTSPSSVQTILTISITYAASFSGNKVIYLAARDQQGTNSHWVNSGIWMVPAPVTYPNIAASAFSTTSLTVTYQDATNNANLSPSQILVNSAVDGRNACYMGYDHVHNLLYLVTDAGDNLLPAITPGAGTGTQQNSQCTVYAQGSSVTQYGNSYTLQVKVSFLPAFRGKMIVYGATQTISGGNTGWQALNLLSIP